MIWRQGAKRTKAPREAFARDTVDIPGAIESIEAL